MEAFQMLLNENFFAHMGHVVVSALMQVHLHSPRFLHQSGFRFLHVLRDGVLAQKLRTLTIVEALCVIKEAVFKVFLIDVQRGAFGNGILFI